MAVAFSECVEREREREREIILVNRIGSPQHGKGEYVTHKPSIILCKVWLKHSLSEGGGGKGGALWKKVGMGARRLEVRGGEVRSGQREVAVGGDCRVGREVLLIRCGRPDPT